MAFPEAIPVRYTEEEAGAVSLRPVVRQTFRPYELLDMILSVTGKEPDRIRRILRSGTVVFHFYRYWWTGFEASEPDLAALLAQFPDSDPTRPFSAAACTKAIIEADGSPQRFSIEITRAAVSRKRLLRRHSLWDALLAAAAHGPLDYAGYSYTHHADLYALQLTAGPSGDARAPGTGAHGNANAIARDRLAAAAASLAPREFRKELEAIRDAAHILFACPRGASR